jgi:hypothetical protein
MLSGVSLSISVDKGVPLTRRVILYKQDSALWFVQAGLWTAEQYKKAECGTARKGKARARRCTLKRVFGASKGRFSEK